MRLKDWALLVTPPVAVRLAKAISGRGAAGHGLSGDYRSWRDAAAASSGYQSEVILEKTRLALLQVKAGVAAAERDSVLFDEIPHPWPVLAGLLRQAARSAGRLEVLDYGGSLGGTYFQCRGFLAGLAPLRWSVVEQPRHVEVGRTWFEDGTLCFFAGLEECLAASAPNVALLGGVLQYLERPHELFAQMQELDCGAIIVDRTPFSAGAEDRLCVQTVPPEIYAASYPSWIFSRARFAAGVHGGWSVLARWENPDRLPGPVEFRYEGMILVRDTDLP